MKSYVASAFASTNAPCVVESYRCDRVDVALMSVIEERSIEIRKGECQV